MYGWHYKTICPFCNHVYEADHGITSELQIRGHGDLWYIEELCPRCATEYYRCLIDSFAFLQRLSGVKEDDAVKVAISMRMYYYGNKRSKFSEEMEERVREQYRAVYSMDERDLFIAQKIVDKEDLTAIRGCCY